GLRRGSNGGRVDVTLLLEDADPIAAVAFRLLERTVGGAHQGVLRSNVSRGVKPDADRYGDRVELGAVDGETLLDDVAPDTLGDSNRAAEMRARQHDQKLLAAVAGHHVDVTNAF